MTMCVRPSAVLYPTRQRSRVANSPSRLPGIDMRSANGRRYAELFKNFAGQFDGGLSETDQGLIRQAATLSLKSEMLAADLAAGKPVDGDLLIRLAGTVKRTLAEVSAASAASKPGPGQALQQYLADRAARLVAEEEGSDGDEESN